MDNAEAIECFVDGADKAVTATSEQSATKETAGGDKVTVEQKTTVQVQPVTKDGKAIVEPVRCFCRFLFFLFVSFLFSFLVSASFDFRHHSRPSLTPSDPDTCIAFCTYDKQTNKNNIQRTQRPYIQEAATKAMAEPHPEKQPMVDTLEAFDKETGKPVPYNPETMPLHMKSKREYA